MDADDAPTAPPADARDAQDLRAFLARVRAHLRRHDGARALLWCAAALGAIALALPLVALGLVGPRVHAIALLAGGGLLAFLVAIIAVVLGAVVPARRWRGDAAVARWVGGRERAIASDLLSSVELDARPGDAAPRRGAPSAVLVDALVAQTSRRIAGLDPRALVPTRAVRQAALACLGVAVVHAAIVVAAPAAVADGWRRMLAPPTGPYAGATLTPTPLVGDLHVTLDAPPYAARPPLVLPSSSGEFRALAGTEVTLETRALAPVASAAVILERPDGVELERLAMEVDGERLRARFVVAEPVRYRFELVRPDRRRLVELTPRQVELEPDLAPSVQLLAPAEELDVSSLRRIELGITAEDDHGIAKVELVWTATAPGGGSDETVRRRLDALERRHAPADPGAPASRRIQGKYVWDLAEIALPPGARVEYHVEVTDNRDVGAPNVGSSRVLRLRVFSPRERHEQNLARHHEVAEKMLRLLGGRLVHHAEGGDDLAVRDELRRVGAEVVVELGTLVAAYDKDPHADRRLRADLDAMRGRIDKLGAIEGKTLDRLPRRGAAKGAGARFAAIDKQLVAELEDDVIALADWLDRERMELLLDVSDELAALRKRLDELLAEYARTGDPRLKAEIDRVLRQLDQRLADLARQRRGMTADVLDQFVHTDAMPDQGGAGCIEEVRRLFGAGRADDAKAKLAECGRGMDAAARRMEEALEHLRGDRFAPEQQKLDELMNELADLSGEQTEIAAETDRIFERYAEKADQLMAELGKEARRKLRSTLDRLRARVDDVPEAGLTPFAQEELDIVRRRLDDLQRMLDDGDLAEALGMARQAKQSLDTVSAELEAALDDDPRSPWAKQTADALDAIERAHTPADKLIEELSALAPSPDQILDPADKRALDKLRRRQAANEERARRLADKARQLAPELPGTAGAEIGTRVDEGARHMDQAGRRMKQRDPSAARDAARSAAEALEKARQRARAAARQQQSDGGAGLDSEPIRIPGADEYRAPEHFREDILEAMKKKAPEGYDEMIKRYYEELIR